MVLSGGCVENRTVLDVPTPRSGGFSGFLDMLEPPGHAPAEPHPFEGCPDGACPREQPAYLFSGEFHETVVDLRVSSCTVGLDLVWARRYRSRATPSQTPLGNGWDHSYNIYFELPVTLTGIGPMLIHDGNARPAVFSEDASGVWTSPRYHRSGEFDLDDRFVLTFADGGQWIFKSAAESASYHTRKLWRIIDRNGNIVELEYDVNDRLERVVGAVGQSLDLEYDGSDHISAVVANLDATTERRVTYERYGSSDPDGNEFDLERVTLPPVVGTVTGNDFPSGTTTTYTYSTGATEPELDGNLLTIADSLGQVYLRNTYATTTNPLDFDFDRLVVQAWGDTTDLVSLTYASVTPSSSNGFAVTKAWMNDRVGRVSEHFFDDDNQPVMVREYTGFADPDLPTDDATNQPTGKLRPGDPSFFETRFSYNVDGHVSQIVHPRGNATSSVYEVDLNPTASPQTRGNLREVHRQGLLCNSGFPTISEYYEYAAGLGNEHGEQNFVVLATNPLGAATAATYDAAGNRTAIIHPEPDTREDMEYSSIGQMTRHRFAEDQHGVRREIVYTYAADGHFRQAIEDPLGFALTTTQEYDASCNETRREDPRGYDKLYTYNERNELIREQSALDTCSVGCGGGVATRAYTDRIYDANMNLVRVDYEALDCDGAAQPNAVVATVFEYDILNELTITRMEIATGQEIVNEIELDANREPTVVLYGQAASGADPSNTATSIYDERGFVYREIRGDGSVHVSSTQHDYDLNGNETQLLEGLEGPTRTTTHTYDCADRVIATVDPMGNRTELDYDAGSNVVERRMYGELVDIPGGANNVLLERTTEVLDTMNRSVEITRDHFDPGTQTAIGDGESVTTVTYDGESRVIAQEDDNGHVTTHDFDTAGRPLETIDAAGNIVALAYDAGGNVTTRTLTDVPSIPGTPQVGVWTSTYDARDNLIEVVDPMGGARHNCYDSLGRLVEEVDPRGNHTLHAYDGAGRLLETTHVLTDDGTGAGTVVGTAVTAQVWDDSDRLISREDPGGNVTQYAYDSLNRLTAETFADGNAKTFTYDVHDNVVVEVDANGTTFEMTYDALERRTDVDITPGPTVIPSTTFESYAHEARSLLVGATDDDTQVGRRYDSLGALISEIQIYDPNLSLLGPTTYTVTYLRDGLGNPLKTGYPSGRTIYRTFDGLQRTAQISENAQTLVQIEYLGPSVLRRTYVPPNTTSDYAYDLSRRMVSSNHVAVGASTIDHRAYAFDAANNKVSADDLAPGSLTGLHLTDHDSLGRTVDSDVTGSASTNRTVVYTLDGAGNRSNVTGDACAGAYAQVGSDALVNQYTETPCEDWSRDPAGNLVQSSSTAASGRDLWLEYDPRGHVANAIVDLGTASEVVLQLAYDALGRKVHTSRSTPTSTSAEQFIYDDYNVIEEYKNGGTSPAATYLYGDGLDDRLQMIRGRPWWYFDDELGSTSALVYRSGGTMYVERYAYQDYGTPSFFWNGTPFGYARSGNPYLFAGSRWLPDPGLYDARTRHLDPVSGRFVSRDSIGIWGDEENLGNGYTYVGNAPDTFTDPTGEKTPKLKNCTTDARAKIEPALEEASKLAKASRDWFNRRDERKRSKRKKEWNNRKFSSGATHPGRDWWGKYNNTRFHRIKWNFRKIRTRLSENVITFKCKSTGNICGNKKSGAWTLSSWHAWIRLCRNDKEGFFTPCGSRRDSARNAGALILHEVSHNINAIGDKSLNGTAMRSASEVQDLAGKKPTRASWNASNYQRFALEIGP